MRLEETSKRHNATCSECNQKVDAAIVFQEEEPHECDEVSLCAECLSKALALLCDKLHPQK